MSIELLTFLFFFSLLVFLLLGLPLSFVLGGVSIIFLYFTWGPESFYMVAAQTWGAIEQDVAQCLLPLLGSIDGNV